MEIVYFDHKKIWGRQFLVSFDHELTTPFKMVIYSLSTMDSRLNVSCSYYTNHRRWKRVSESLSLRALTL